MTHELIWIKQLKELKFEDTQQMKLCSDNEATLHIASNLVFHFHERTKHIYKLMIILFGRKLSLKKPLSNFSSNH